MKDVSLNPAIEMKQYISTMDYQAKIPYIGRANTVKFVENIYSLGGSIIVSKIKNYFIVEIIVLSPLSKIRDILLNIIKIEPSYIIECVPRKFKVGWKLNF